MFAMSGLAPIAAVMLHCHDRSGQSRLCPQILGHAADLPAQGAPAAKYQDRLVAEHAGRDGGPIAVSWLPETCDTYAHDREAG
jgi:hypothetical protein